MLVKVKDVNGQWVLFDNAEKIKYSTEPETFTHQRDIYYLLDSHESGDLTLVLPGVNLEEISNDNPLRVGVIRFQRLGKPIVIVFNTLIYICNDQGKTVEKVMINEE